MKSDPNNAHPPSGPQPKTQTRRTAKQADRDPAPASPRGHTFPASIQLVVDETATLSAIVQEWLARGVDAFLQAVKHQLALLAAPPERKLLPPRASGDEEEPNERTLQAVLRPPRRRCR